MKEKLFEIPIIDSNMTLEEALKIDQKLSAPQEILEKQRIVEVQYFSFDRTLHKGQIVVHVDLVEDVGEAFDIIRKSRFPVFSVIPVAHKKFMWDDKKSMLQNNSSGFNYRTIAKTNRLSNHAFGKAIDINPAINPYMLTGYRFPEDVDYDPTVPGTIIANSPLVAYFKKNGWVWGGEWTDIKDYQHFEKPIV